MQAKVSKKESKSFFGGINYLISITLELTDNERKVFSSHNLANYQMISEEFREGLPPDLHIKVLHRACWASMYVKGVEMKFSSLALMTNFEAEFYDGCKGLKTQLDALANAQGDIDNSKTVEF